MELRFVRTCYACPEQYDVLDESGSVVAYLRLRHGQFTVQCPNSQGNLVLALSTKGDGIFDSTERDMCLGMAWKAIEEYYNNVPVKEVNYEEAA